MKEEINFIVFIFFAIVFLILFLPGIVREVEKRLYYSFGKIYFAHHYFVKRKLTASEKEFLEKNVSFYRKLDTVKKRSFEHRVACFIAKYDFHSRGNFRVTEAMKLLIASSAVTLTFGFRNFTFSILDLILIYPKAYPSKKTKRIHKGEFNPRLRILVLSWEDFVKGYEIANDNINLGVHEFTHIIHINSYKKKDISSVIFKKEFAALKRMIQKNSKTKNKLVTSEYFRRYAFENQYEFIAVLIENFIETPKEFKMEFPQIYKKIKKMLNYNFQGY